MSPIRTVLLTMLVGGTLLAVFVTAELQLKREGKAIITPIGPIPISVKNRKDAWLLPANRTALGIEPVTGVPAVPESVLVSKSLALPKDEYREYFEALSRPFVEPTLKDFKEVVVDQTLATALWQAPVIREAHRTQAYVFWVLMFVQGYYEREVMRARYNFLSVPLATDLGDVWGFLLREAADPSVMRIALNSFESAVAVAVALNNHEVAYDAEEFRTARDQVESQIRSVPCSVQALQLLQKHITGESK